MRYLLRYDATISAAHQLDFPDARCGTKMHGHEWRIFLEVAGFPHPDTYQLNSNGPMVLSTILLELHGKTLNEMMRGTQPTAEGLASYLLERLRLDTPGLVSVAVEIPNHRVTVEV